MSHPTHEISAHLRGELDGEARRKVTDHLIDCRECRAEFLSLKKTREILGYLPELGASPGFAERVLDSCRELALEETRADLAIEIPPRRPLLWLAVPFLAAILLVWWAIQPGHQPEPNLVVYTGEPREMSSAAPSAERKEDSILPLEPREEGSAPEMPGAFPEDFPLDLGTVEILSFDEAQPEVFPEPPPPEWEPWALPPRLVPVIPPWSEPAPDVSRVSEDVGNYGKNKQVAPVKDSFWILPLVSQDGSLPEPFHSPSGAFAAVNIPRILELRMAFFPSSPCGKAMGMTLGNLLEQEMRGGLGDNLYHHALLTYNLTQFKAPSLRRQIETSIRYLLKRQNKDGGFGFVEGAPSNAVVSGWAALALMEARDLGLDGTVNPLAKVRGFFARLTDPRSGECGLSARGDGRLMSLCSVFSHLVFLDRRAKGEKDPSDERIWGLVMADLKIQERQVTHFVDLDALLAYRILAEKLGRLENWRQTTQNLLVAMSQHLPQGRFEAWSPLARGIWVEILR